MRSNVSSADGCDVQWAKVGDKSLTAKEGGLTRTMKSSFSDLCIKYEDVRNVDRMAAVQASCACGLSLSLCITIVCVLGGTIQITKRALYDDCMYV